MLRNWIILGLLSSAMGCGMVVTKRQGNSQVAQEVKNSDSSAPQKVSAEDIESDADKDRFVSALKGGSEKRIMREASKLLAEKPKDADVLNALGAYYISKKNPGIAKIFLQRAIQGKEDHSAALNNLGVIAMDEGKDYQAVALFKQSIASDDDNFEALGNLGSYYLKYQDYEKANEYLKKAYKENSKDAAIASNYAVSLRGLGKEADALDIYEDIAGGSRNVGAMLNQAILWAEYRKDYTKAKEILKKVRFLSTDPAILRKVNSLSKNMSKAQK